MKILHIWQRPLVMCSHEESNLKSHFEIVWSQFYHIFLFIMVFAHFMEFLSNSYLYCHKISYWQSSVSQLIISSRKTISGKYELSYKFFLSDLKFSHVAAGLNRLKSKIINEKGPRALRDHRDMKGHQESCKKSISLSDSSYSKVNE